MKLVRALISRALLTFVMAAQVAHAQNTKAQKEEEFLANDPVIGIQCYCEAEGVDPIRNEIYLYYTYWTSRNWLAVDRSCKDPMRSFLRWTTENHGVERFGSQRVCLVLTRPHVDGFVSHCRTRTDIRGCVYVNYSPLQ